MEWLDRLTFFLMAGPYLYRLRQPRHADELRALLQLQLGGSSLCFHLQRGGGLGGHMSLRLRG